MPSSPTDNQAPSPRLRTILLAADNKNSIVAEIAGDQPNPIAYSAYGQQSAQQQIATRLGFNGDLRETPIGWYLLGNGYRAYNPTLMRFHSPDSWSPFGGGGLNAYKYCGGDPVNFSDPTGHMIGLFKKLTRLSGRNTTRAASSSSLSPLISDAAQNQRGISNPNFVDTGPMPIYENIQVIAGMSPGKVAPHKTIAPRLGDKIPPPIPPKRKPRFNDSGGQVDIISPNWKPDKPLRCRAIWESKPFEKPFAPLPATRTLPDGTTRHYRVRYDDYGNPTQTSVAKVSLPPLKAQAIRNAKE